MNSKQEIPQGNQHNKNINSSQRVYAHRGSVVENYFSSGRLPAYNATLNSISKNCPLDQHNDNTRDLTEFTRKIKGTDVTTKVRMKRIENIREECTFDTLEKFECLAASNDWNDETMAIIFTDLIDDNTYKHSLSTSSYKKLREQILELLYPRSELRFFTTRLETTKQKNFSTIGEYHREIEKYSLIITTIQNLTQKEHNRRITDAFYRGLGEHTSLELLKQGIDPESIEETIKYLRRLEEGILLQSNLRQLKVNHSQRNPRTTTDTNFLKAEDRKWCSIHKMTSHNTKDCSLNKTSTAYSGSIHTPPSSQNNSKRSLIISESIKDQTRNVEIEAEIKDTTYNFVVDSGADVNYVSKTAADELNFITEETKPITLIFGGGTKEITNMIVRECIKIKGKSYQVDFYVIKELPVKFILGNDFLSRHDCVLDFKKRSIKIGHSTQIPFAGEKEPIEDKLEDRLSDKACLTIIQEFPELNKTLKQYMNDNESFTHINVRPAHFSMRDNLKVVQSYGYPISFKFIDKGKEEIKRLLHEDIIEPSNSIFTSPAFFREKKNKKLRLILDYKKINVYIEDDSFLLPKIDDCLIKIGENKYFSQLDLQNGFNQIKIDENSRKYTSFMLLGKQYQYKRIPFGIKPGPKTLPKTYNRNIRRCRKLFCIYR
ncbi:Retrovirus-related Pol polyprotein from transposon [Nosema granulosis]|uniref:Retrovirus-related Pol polyprotein from transposon n=1 Tax=Nosema granulosis TaxID=83296 RepID=A0A9P6GVU2_9MICR|nr:Retrovirus-related Pol polyprotein from transposon [Nosema granulosis]